MLTNILLWVLWNADTVGGILFALHALALGIVNLTATPADDVFVGKAYRIIEAMAGIITATAKAAPKNRPRGNS